MAFDGTRYLANGQHEIRQRYELAIGDNRSSEEIAELEQLLNAIAIMLDARTCEHTFH